MRLLPFIFVVTVCVGCGKSEESGSSKKVAPVQTQSAEIDKAILGKWITAATSAGHYDGVLNLSPDGTFREEDVFKSDGSIQKVEGTFKFESGASPEVVLLTVTKLDGSTVSGGPPTELTFDRKEQTLTNLMPGLVYVRPATKSSG